MLRQGGSATRNVHMPVTAALSLCLLAASPALLCDARPKELVNPNLHVVLVHFPLALLLAGLAIEVFSFMYRRSSFRAAGRCMILLGALASVPTALSGAYAFADVARRTMPAVEQRELADSPGAARHRRRPSRGTACWNSAGSATMGRDRTARARRGGCSSGTPGCRRRRARSR